jgi:hypothetical protein
MIIIYKILTSLIVMFVVLIYIILCYIALWFLVLRKINFFKSIAEDIFK